MSDRLVTVAAFQDPVAANLAKNFLESEGIPATIVDEWTVSTLWSVANAIGGIKLQVAAFHLERAEMLLSQAQDDHADVDGESPATQTAIATEEIAEELRAEREDKEPVNQLVDRLFRVLVLGMLFWPLQLYTLWLLLQLMSEPGQVSANRRWKIWVGMLLSPIILVTFLILACTCSFPSMLP